VFLHQSIAIAASSTPSKDNAERAQYFTPKIKYKSEGTRALKELLLQSPSSHPEVPPNLYMNGLIISVPWQGRQEYKLM
jgi:hypothetical protein